MLHNYTPDDLLLYIYNEVDELEREKIKHALETDPELSQIYKMMVSVTGTMDAVSYDPSPTTIEIILEHSHHQEHLH